MMMMMLLTNIAGRVNVSVNRRCVSVYARSLVISRAKNGLRIFRIILFAGTRQTNKETDTDNNIEVMDVITSGNNTHIIYVNEHCKFMSLGLYNYYASMLTKPGLFLDRPSD